MRGQDGCSFGGVGATLGVENRTGIRMPSLYGVLGIVGCRIRVILLFGMWVLRILTNLFS